MSSYLEAIREFHALTRQREQGSLDDHLERRFQDLSAWIESGADTDPPPEEGEASPVAAAPDATPAFVLVAEDVPEVKKEPTLKMLRKAEEEQQTSEEDIPPLEQNESAPQSEWLASPQESSSWESGDFGPPAIAPPAPLDLPDMSAEDDLPDEEFPSPSDELPGPAAEPRNPVEEKWFDDGLWEGAPPPAPLEVSQGPSFDLPAEDPPLPAPVEDDFPPAEESGGGAPWLTSSQPALDVHAEQSIGSILREAPSRPLPPRSIPPPPRSIPPPPQSIPPPPRSISAPPPSAPPKSVWSAPTKPIRNPNAEVTGAPGVRPVHLPPPPIFSGEHRVVVHTIEGQVKRGTAEDVDLGANGVNLRAAPGANPELIPFSRTKALFFLLAPGERAPEAKGKRVQVAFIDGRRVDGFLGEDIGTGFFLTPVDARTNTARVYVLRHAVRAVSP